MAFETRVSHFMPRQHARVYRTMSFMARPAALILNRSMLERERPALVAMAFETSRLIGREGLLHRRPDAAVRIVAIHALHVAFGKLVMEWPLELRPLA